MHKLYEVNDTFFRNGNPVEIGTKLTLHEREAKYLPVSEVKPDAEEAEKVEASDAEVQDPRAEALLPLIDRRAKTRNGA